MAKDSETVLEGFQEGALKFPPTYKFDVGTDTYDTRLVTPLCFFLIPGNWSIITALPKGSILAPSPGYVIKHVYFNSISLSVFHPAGRSVNQLGPTGFCGAWELRPGLLSTQGSVGPCWVWPAGPKWPSTTTEATWSTQSVTTNLCPPSSPCRWDL